MWRRIASWRSKAAADGDSTPADPPDRDKLALVGDTLRCSYGEEDESLDDRLVALMLELSVERPGGLDRGPSR